MRKILKKLLLILLSLFVFSQAVVFAAPSFSSSFWNYMHKDTWDGATVYNLWVDKNYSLKDNIYQLFYPTSWWKLWNVTRTIWAWMFILFLVRSWFLLLLNADNDWNMKKAKLNFIFLLYWAFLFFWATWILWSALQVWTFSGTQWNSWIIDNFQNWLMLQMLWFLKAAAFFLAIVMIIYRWFNMIRAYEQEDKIKAAKKWVLNVVTALIFIKIIDYIYYIAQTSEFKSRAWELIVSFSKIMWFVLWWLFLLSIFYAWAMLITSSWDEDKWKKAKATVTTVFLVSVVVMLFLLIAYQVVAELT